jgi:hypothetical protein
MQEIRKTDHFPKYDSTVISEIKDGIYRISGFPDS